MPKYNERAIPPGSFTCPVEGCTGVFDSKERLKSHIRVFHHIGSTSSLSRGFFSFQGDSITVPPSESNVVDYQLRYCPNHVMTSGKCAVCLEIEGDKSLPKPPFKLYPLMKFDFVVRNMMDKAMVMATSAADRVLNPVKKKFDKPKIKIENDVDHNNDGSNTRRKSSTHAIHLTSVIFSTNDTQYGVIVSGRCFEPPGYDEHLSSSNSNDGSNNTWKGRPLQTFLDRNQDGWMIVQVLLEIKDLMAINFKIPTTYDKLREYELLTSEIAKSLNVMNIRCIPVANIRDKFNLRIIGRNDPVPATPHRTGPAVVYYARTG